MMPAASGAAKDRFGYQRNSRAGVPAGKIEACRGNSTNPSVPASAAKSPEVLVGWGCACRAPAGVRAQLDGQEVGQVGRELHLLGQAHPFLGHRLGAHGPVNRRNHIADQADEGRYGVPRQGRRPVWMPG